MIMAESSSLTFRLPNATKAKLAKLADHTRRSRSFLAAEAVTAYVERELAIVEAIERGQADVRAGRVVSNDDVFRDLDAIFEAVRAGE